MKIAIFTDTFFPKTDGVVTSTINLIRQLQAQGHQVLVVAPRPKNLLTSRLEIPGVKIVWLRSLPTGFYPDLRMGLWSPHLSRHLKSFAMEIAHIMTPMPIGLMGMTYAKLQKVPIVMTFHTYYMDPQYLKIVKIDKAAQVISNFGWQSAKLFYNEADLIVAPSAFVAKDLYKWGFSEPIEVIPNGLSLNLAPASLKRVAQLQKNYGLAGKKVLLTVGRVSAEKNFDGLLRIFRAVVKIEPKAHLLIIGKGPALSAVRKMVKKMQLQSQVTLAGEIAHQRLLKDGYYQLGQIFVTASMSETQGLTALEAQLAQLPVIAYNSRGLAEVIGSAGILIEENDEVAFCRAIVDLLQHPQKVRQLRLAIPTNLARFDLKNTTNELLAQYQKLLKTH